MRQAVLNAFIAFNVRFESNVPYMYLDSHRKVDGTLDPFVTTGVGNLIDPVELALALPWKRVNATQYPLPFREKGAAATRGEITAEWNRVKMSTSRATGKTAYWISSANLYLELEDVDKLVLAKMQANEKALRARFLGYTQWPADAQLALHSMAWAMGPAFKFPHFETACALFDFATASVECHMDDAHNAGLVPRNAANKIMLVNASLVASRGLDRETLYYPRALTPVSADVEGRK